MTTQLAASPFECSAAHPTPGIAPVAHQKRLEDGDLADSGLASMPPLGSGAPTLAAAPLPPPPSQPWPNEAVLFGQCTLPGTRYGSLNQDYVVTLQLHDPKHLRQHRWPQCYITAVLDGHGMLGEVAAREAGSHIMHALKHSALRHRQLADMTSADVERLMRDAFAAGHTAALSTFDHPPQTYIFPVGSRYEQRYTLLKHESGDKLYSSTAVGNRMLEFGTSATVAVVQGSTVVVADVGDSLAVLGREEQDNYIGDIVSVRHFGWDDGERERLQQQCGSSVSVSDEDGYLTVVEGRLKGFQLAMTRALGHRLLEQYGVISTPSVTFHQLRAEHVCLIVATDGVWESLSPSEAVKLVCDVMAEGRSAEEAAHELCQAAVRLATGARQAGKADNTSATVFVFAEL